MVRTREIAAESADVVLRYTGDGTRFVRNVPGRDLTGADIARLAYVRDLAVVANEVGQPVDTEKPDGPRITGPDPREPNAETVRAVLDELDESGLYEATATKAKPAERPTEEPTPEPAPPAEEPEG